MGTYRDSNYISYKWVPSTSMNRKRRIMAIVDSDTDDNITDFTEAMAVINYIKRTI